MRYAILLELPLTFRSVNGTKFRNTCLMNFSGTHLLKSKGTLLHNNAEIYELNVPTDWLGRPSADPDVDHDDQTQGDHGIFGPFKIEWNVYTTVKCRSIAMICRRSLYTTLTKRLCIDCVYPILETGRNRSGYLIVVTGQLNSQQHLVAGLLDY
jgi:hypothetical protein